MIDLDAIRKRLAAVPDLPLLVLPKAKGASYTTINMNDHGDGRFVASVNENWGAYATLFANAIPDIAALLAEVARLSTVLATRDNECGRIYYLPHTQQDRVCRMPRGHAPEVGGCEGDEVSYD